MKKWIILLPVLFCLFNSSCAKESEPVSIAATTLPVYEFTQAICHNTDLTVQRLITESVSCLHDYSLNVDQVRVSESAEVVVISGAGLEDFMEDILPSVSIDSSVGISLLCEEEHDTHVDHGHQHEEDPHIWLSPENAKIMAQNICEGLCSNYPTQQETFRANLDGLVGQLDQLKKYGDDQLSSLSTRKLITFHDGFSYFAASFDLDILDAVEEESGSEASAQELIRLITLVQENHLPAIFVEKNGSPSAASVISTETGAKVYALDMAMSESGYFEAMYHNINTIKEALG